MIQISTLHQNTIISLTKKLSFTPISPFHSFVDHIGDRYEALFVEKTQPLFSHKLLSHIECRARMNSIDKSPLFFFVFPPKESSLEGNPLGQYLGL